MNRIIKISLILLTYFSPSFLSVKAQQVITFQKTYPVPIVDQSGRDVLETSDGGYLIVGMTGNPNYWDTSFYIMKTNLYGDTLWTKTYGCQWYDYPYSALETPDGNYFVLGFTRCDGAVGETDMWLLKLNSVGNIIWKKIYGGAGQEEGREIIPVSDGNYLIAGRSNSVSIPEQACLIKIDPLGNVIWEKYYGGNLYETAHSVKECSDHGFIFTGTTFSYGNGGSDIYLVRTNSTGDTLWTKTIGGTGIDDGNFIVYNTDGSFTIAAETNSSGNGDMDVQIIKTDANGEIIWNKTYGGTDKDVSKTIQHTTDGGYVVGAISRSFGWIDPDMWVLKLDANGDTTWTRHYGSYDHEHCHFVRQTSDGGYIAVGHSRSFSPNKRVMFVKTDQLGTFGTTGTEELLSTSVFTNVFPNPTEGIVTVTVPAHSSHSMNMSTLKISNALGQVIYGESFSSGSDFSKTINLEKNEPGIYLLTLQSEKELYTQKLLIR